MYPGAPRRREISEISRPPIPRISLAAQRPNIRDIFPQLLASPRPIATTAKPYCNTTPDFERVDILQPLARQMQGNPLPISPPPASFTLLPDRRVFFDVALGRDRDDC